MRTEVLVVGSGPAGASAALFLASYGVDVLLITRSTWLADSPRAHITNLRTMEIMRDMGLEQACYAQASPRELMSNRIWATSFAGEELARIRAWGTHPGRQGDYELASPARMCDLPQTLLEPILVSEAARLGARLRFANELIDFNQDEEGVSAYVTDPALDEPYEVRADYMIGADGGRSLVVEKLGLPMLGTPSLASAFHVHIKADLSRYAAHRPGSLYTIYRPGLRDWGGSGTFRMVRPWSEWVVSFTGMASSNGASPGQDEVLERLKDMIGDPEVAVDVIGASRWFVNHLVAARYGEGRVFCAGDAVHRHPPKNGLGSNTSIQDSYNLCWKLALVLRGVASRGLLETYNDERQPVGQGVVDRAVKSFGDDLALAGILGLQAGQDAAAWDLELSILQQDSPDGERRREALRQMVQKKNYTVNALGIELNQHYQSRAVVPDGIPQIPFTRDTELYYEPTAKPGARLPHCWLELDRKLVSTLDLTGHGRFALFTSARGVVWKQAALAVEKEFRLHLAIWEIGPGFPVKDVYGDWANLSGVDESGCVLVRPDMHVAWRSASCTADASAALCSVMRRILLSA